MPQYPLVPREGGNASHLDISVATVVKSTPGTLFTINVTTAGSAPGSANDVATTGGVAATNEICVIPNTVGIYSLSWPCATGITITPGTGQVISVAYS